MPSGGKRAERASGRGSEEAGADGDGCGIIIGRREGGAISRRRTIPKKDSVCAVT